MKEIVPNPDQSGDAPKAKDKFQDIGGSPSYDWNIVLVDQAAQSLWTGNSPSDKCDSQFNATVAAFLGIGPKDELEGMMAAQLIAAHNATMECYRRAMLTEQTLEGRREALNQANKLSRTYAMLVDALNKHRGKGQQKVTVEHVHVYAGGQAVVGTIEQKGGGQKKLEDQPHAQQITYAPEPALWGENAGENALPIPSDGQWSLPNAWREFNGGTDEEF
jgi:hypothetical protein